MGPTTRVRVLLVDDDTDIRLLTRTRLEMAGAEVVGEATEAESGIAMAAEHRPNLIVLDERMPGRRGSEAIVDFREAVPGVRIVMYTAFPRESVGRDCADAYVEKTAPLQSLLDACFPNR